MLNAPRNPFAPPQAHDPDLVPPPTPPDAATRGQRIAGIVLILNALLVVAEVAVIAAPPAGLPNAPGGGVMPAILDFGIGVALASGSRKVVPWAILRAALGGVLHAGLRMSAADPFGAAMAVLVSAALLALLVGDAGRLRVAAGATGFGLYACLGALGVVGTLYGTNVLAGLIMSASGELEPGTVGRVEGQAFPYSITAPGDSWRLRTDAATKKDNAIADRWLVQPGKDAHVVVVAEHLPGGTVQIDRFADTVLDNARKASTRFELVSREPLRGHADTGRLVRTRATVNGMDLDYAYGLVAGGERAFQVYAFSAHESFAAMEDELLQIVESFELPEGALRPHVPDDVEPSPAARVVGLAYGYTVTAPGGAWHTRTDDAAKKGNALVDRWLVRLDADAHVIIIAEHEPGAVIPIDPFTDAVMDGARANATRFEITGREPLTGRLDSGRLVRASAIVNGLDLEYRYGLVTAGDRAFQVIGFAQRDVFPRVEADILAIIGSFRLPEAP